VIKSVKQRKQNIQFKPTINTKCTYA